MIWSEHEEGITRVIGDESLWTGSQNPGSLVEMAKKEIIFGFN